MKKLDFVMRELAAKEDPVIHDVTWQEGHLIG